ncbi:M16 family metallopeptidase [Acinetobacter puyangensis]|uniref:M16 family metallopeptidase n=1 Tax=Acinetobacter puyangensis TaxID=1096779 RepID=UPI003A4D84BF
MKNLTPCVLLCSILTSPFTSSQEFEQDFNLNSDPQRQQPITATQYLQSLRDLPSHQSFSAPYVQEIYSDNKVRTLFAESHSLPIVDIQLTFNAGSARDQSIGSGLYGLANLTAQLLNEGTTTQSADDIARTFENLGAQYSAQAYRDMFIIKLRVMSDEKRLTPAINQLILLLKGANFPQSSIDRLFSNAQVGQQQVQENPSRTMSVRFYRAIYGKHPYAEPVTGTIQSLRRISSRDIQAFKNRYLVANNMNIAITGDLNAIQVKKIANQISHILPLGEPAAALPDAKPLEKSTIINLAFNSSQAHVMMGEIGIQQSNPDRFALQVGNEILGSGGFNSMLMKELREKRGLTYSVSSRFNSMQSQGLFSLNYSTNREQLLDSIEVTYQTLLDFLYQPLDENLVESTKTSMLRAFPQILSSNASINAQLGMMGFYQLPSNYLSEYPTYISSVTAEDIQAAWQRHFDPQKMLTITAGKDIDGEAIAKIYRTVLQRHLENSQPTKTSPIESGQQPMQQQ